MPADIIDFTEARLSRIRRLTVAANVEQQSGNTFFDLAELHSSRTLVTSNATSSMYIEPTMFDQIFIDERIDTFPAGARLSFLHARAGDIGGENATRAVMTILNFFIQRRRGNGQPIVFAPSLRSEPSKRTPAARFTR